MFVLSTCSWTTYFTWLSFFLLSIFFVSSSFFFYMHLASSLHSYYPYTHFFYYYLDLRLHFFISYTLSINSLLYFLFFNLLNSLYHALHQLYFESPYLPSLFLLTVVLFLPLLQPQFLQNQRQFRVGVSFFNNMARQKLCVLTALS